MSRVLRSLVLVMLIAAGVAAVPAAARPPGPPTTRLATLPAGPGFLHSPFPASHIGVRWRGAETAPIEVRSGEPGRMGPWRAMSVSHDLGDEERGIHFSGLLRADGATRVQARAGQGVSDLQVVVIDAVSRFEGRQLGLPAAEPASAGPSQPNVISRATWGADESMRKGTPEFAPISKLIVHHTVTPNDDPDPASTVRAIYAYHTRGNGWNDIGYNFLIDSSGRIYEGRFARSYNPGEIPNGEDETGRGVIGAHAKTANQGSTGVALLGEFSGGAQPTAAALDSLVRLLAWKAGRHGINPEKSDAYTGADGNTRTFPNIAGHRDVGDTACPGDRFYERLPEVRRRVAEALALPTPAPPAEPAPPVQPPVPLPGVPGFWSATAAGQVRAYGDAPPAGDLSGRRLNAPIVAMAATPGGRGYWLAGADGGVFAFGDAPFLGTAAGQLTAPAVDLEPTPTGKGYWVLFRSGEVVAFGDAAYRGSTALLPFEMVDMATTPSGQGYWIVSADGRVFAFGDAVLKRATATAGLVSGAGGEPAPTTGIVAIAAHPDGRGYWLLGRDGGVFAFDVPFHGSVPDRRAYQGAVELRVTESGGGYYIAGEDGSVFAFGDADRRRERSGRPEDAGVVDWALRPTATPRQTEESGTPEMPGKPGTPGLPTPPDVPAPEPAPAPPGPPGPPEGAEPTVLSIR